MGDVVPLFQERPKPKGKSNFPEHLSLHDVELLLTWAKRKRFTFEQTSYAVEQVRDWAETNGQQRKLWWRVIRRAMSARWALVGFKDECERLGTLYPGRKLTDEGIQKFLVHLHNRGRR